MAFYKAYTFYKKAADEVKAHGRYVFAGTERADAYISDYRSNLGKRGRRNAAETSSPEVASSPTDAPMVAEA